MNFKPFTKKRQFDQEVLTKNFPQYFHEPIAEWLYQVLLYEAIETDRFRVNGSKAWLKNDFKNNLHILFREAFPSDWVDFVTFLLDDQEILCDILALCLQKYATIESANKLKHILSQGGSAFKVISLDDVNSNFDLQLRVPEVIEIQSQKALSRNQQLLDAWHFCYSRKPDYEKTVTKCCNFLEGYLRDKYFPRDPGPQLVKFVHQLRDDPSKLAYKGSDMIYPKNLVTDLLVDFSNFRGQHTEGLGKIPSKEHAEFVLHTTIYIWNVHN